MKPPSDCFLLIVALIEYPTSYYIDRSKEEEGEEDVMMMMRVHIWRVQLLWCRRWRVDTTAAAVIKDKQDFLQRQLLLLFPISDVYFLLFCFKAVLIDFRSLRAWFIFKVKWSSSYYIILLLLLLRHSFRFVLSSCCECCCSVDCRQWRRLDDGCIILYK